MNVQNQKRYVTSISSVFLLIFACVTIDTFPTQTSTRRFLQAVTSDTPTSPIDVAKTEGVSSENDECKIDGAKPRKVKPTLVASYPGSGARMTWKLIRATTGIMTGEELDRNGLVESGEAISIKTHYPAHTQSDIFDKLRHVDRAILLIRNPLHALPSFHNFLYEMKNELPNHSTRAPVRDWIVWRDEFFDDELKRWKYHIMFYITKFKAQDRIAVSYEQLIKDDTGPRDLRRMKDFMAETVGFELRNDEEIPCVWTHVVKHREDEGTKRSSLRKGGPTTYPFTQRQIKEMLKVMDVLKKHHPVELKEILEGYEQELRALTPSEEKTDVEASVPVVQRRNEVSREKIEALKHAISPQS